MLITLRDATKFIGIFILSCCAVLVCTMFLNFYLDLIPIKDVLTTPQEIMFYEAQLATAKVVVAVSAGCLLITSVVMLLFYIKHFIDFHKKELGILKALGYSNWKLAKKFWIFGGNVLLGCLLGYGLAFLLMPSFYAMQNKEKLLPEVSIQMHPSLLFFLVVLPAMLFGILSICYACFQLKQPVLPLLRDSFVSQDKGKEKARRTTTHSFLKELKMTTLRSKKALAFFMIFASFCFSAMTQMSFGMKDLASEMMGSMVLMIGLVLAFTSLFMAITTIIKGNTKTIAMMRVFGYSQKECCHAVLGGYRWISYLGFAIGTLYQYGLLRIMVDIVFRDVEGVPTYEFDFPIMWLTLFLFVALYECIMLMYTQKIKQISIKEIMLES